MAAEFPDGIEERHLGENTRRDEHRHWKALPFLGALMLLALAGLFGGWPNRTHTTRQNDVLLAVEAPSALRSGEFFEIWVTVEAHRALAEPTIAFSAPYLRNLTINTVMPEGSEEGYANGAFLLTYDPLDTGKRLRIKLDGQVNPTLGGGNDGWIELRDGEAPLARIALGQRILP